MNLTRHKSIVLILTITCFTVSKCVSQELFSEITLEKGTNDLKMFYNLIKPGGTKINQIEKIDILLRNGKNLDNDDILIFYGSHKDLPKAFLVDIKKSVYDELVKDLEIQDIINTRVKTNQFRLISTEDLITSEKLFLRYNKNKLQIFEYDIPSAIADSLINSEKYIKLTLKTTEVRIDTIIESSEADNLLPLIQDIVSIYDTLYYMGEQDVSRVNLEVRDHPEISTLLSTYSLNPLYLGSISYLDLDTGEKRIINIYKKKEQDINDLNNLYENNEPLVQKKVKSLSSNRVIDDVLVEEKNSIYKRNLYSTEKTLEPHTVYTENKSYDIYMEPGFPGELTIRGESGVGELKKWVIPALSFSLLLFFSQ